MFFTIGNDHLGYDRVVGREKFSFPVAFKANLIADITQIAHAVTFFVSYEESYLHGFKSQAKRLFAEDGLGSLIPVIHAEGEFRTAEGKPFLIDIQFTEI